MALDKACNNRLGWNMLQDNPFGHDPHLQRHVRVRPSWLRLGKAQCRPPDGTACSRAQVMPLQERALHPSARLSLCPKLSSAKVGAVLLEVLHQPRQEGVL